MGADEAQSSRWFSHPPLTVPFITSQLQTGLCPNLHGSLPWPARDLVRLDPTRPHRTGTRSSPAGLPAAPPDARSPGGLPAWPGTPATHSPSYTRTRTFTPPPLTHMGSHMYGHVHMLMHRHVHIQSHLYSHTYSCMRTSHTYTRTCPTPTHPPGPSRGMSPRVYVSHTAVCPLVSQAPPEQRARLLPVTGQVAAISSHVTRRRAPTSPCWGPPLDEPGQPRTRPRARAPQDPLAVTAEGTQLREAQL